MSNIAWNLQTAIYEALKDDAPLMAMVSGVYDHVPQRTEFPYVTIGDDTASDWSSKSFTGENVTLTLHIWSRYKGRKEVKNIISRIKSVLNNADIEITGNTLILLRHDYSDSFRDKDGETYHGVVRFRALIQEN